MNVEVWSVVLSMGIIFVIWKIVAFMTRQKDALDCPIVEKAPVAKQVSTAGSEIDQLAQGEEKVKASEYLCEIATGFKTVGDNQQKIISLVAAQSAMLRAECFDIRMWRTDVIDELRRLEERLFPEEPVVIADENVAHIRISELDFSGRTRNCLMRTPNGPVETIEDLVQCSRRDLTLIRNFGRKSMAEVRERLAHYGLKLRGDSVWVAEKPSDD